MVHHQLTTHGSRLTLILSYPSQSQSWPAAVPATVPVPTLVPACCSCLPVPVGSTWSRPRAFKPRGETGDAGGWATAGREKGSECLPPPPAYPETKKALEQKEGTEVIRRTPEHDANKTGGKQGQTRDPTKTGHGSHSETEMEQNPPPRLVRLCQICAHLTTSRLGL